MSLLETSEELNYKLLILMFTIRNILLTFFLFFFLGLTFRFAEVAELRTISWLEIQGLLNTRLLSPKTCYGAYLIVKFADRAYGLDSVPSEVSLEVGNYKSHGTMYLSRPKSEKQSLENIHYVNRIKTLRSNVFEERQGLGERKDGWIEIELGYFYNDLGDEEVKMCLKEVKGEHLKGGLIVEGIEIRPKE